MSEIIAVFQSQAPPLDTHFENDCWQQARALTLDYNWRGAPAPSELLTSAMTLWTTEELWFGFECRYTELDIDTECDLTQERHALWDRDVCEAFVRSPLETDPRRYKEFEVAPTGQWCDLQIDRARLDHDWRWQSGMRTAHEINEAEKTWRAVMAIPFTAFGLRPQSSDCWQGNLFRVSRLHGERQYLTLSPTFTEKPSFHVPERFVNLRFAE